MNHPNDENLLGYVLGALDAQEQRDVQEALDADSQLDEQLLAIKSALAPLDYLDTSGPRPGLARRTCELVASINARPLQRLDKSDFYSNSNSSLNSSVSATLASHAMSATNPDRSTARSALSTHNLTSVLLDKPNFSRDTPRQLWLPSTWSLPDFVMAVAVMAMMAGLLFPAVSYSRYNSRLLGCQNNLRQLGQAFAQYSETHGGRQMEIPRSGPLSVCGSFAPILKDGGFVPDDSLFGCPGLTGGSGRAVPIRIPSIQSLKQASGQQLIQLHQNISGDYGGSMGYVSTEGYVPPSNLGRTNVVLLADMPSMGCSGRISSNHGGGGQNCLYEDGHVGYVYGDSIGQDAIFVNDYNLVAPGCRPEDNVIAPSHLSPSFAYNRQLKPAMLED